MATASQKMMEIKFLETMRGILTAEPTMLTPAMKIPLNEVKDLLYKKWTYQAAPIMDAPRTIERPTYAQKLGSMQ